MGKHLAVAIDGPSGAGKSTAAKAVAAALGITYIDSGAMYRAVALYNLKNGVDLNDERAVEGMLPFINIELNYNSEGQRVFLNGGDVTAALRSQEVAEGSSQAARYEAVRTKCVALQQKLAETRDVVMDGRDIGTVVLPGAQVKIYLDADVETRAARRIGELEAKGVNAEPSAVRDEIITRDKRDMGRAHSPLTPAADAVYIDSSGLSQDEVAERIIALVNKRTNADR